MLKGFRNYGMTACVSTKVGAFVFALFILHLIVILAVVKYFTIATAGDNGKSGNNDTSKIRVTSSEIIKNHDFWRNFIISSEEPEEIVEESEEISNQRSKKEEAENEEKTTAISTIQVVNLKENDEYEISPPLLATTKIHITPIQMWKKYKNSVEHKEVDDYTTTKEPPDIERLPTLVTALLDIGRGHWKYYARTISIYHNYMFHVLSLKLPVVVFVDDHSYEFVIRTREKLGLQQKTKVFNITMHDLPLYRHINVIRGILENELSGKSWKSTYEPSTQTHPEARIPEYDLVVNSKPYFLYNASAENPFNSSNFIWLDAGYGQGKVKNFPEGYEWKPNFLPDKISVIKITPTYDSISRYTLEKLYRQDWSVISGGFLAGNRQAVYRYYRYYHWKVVELLFRHQMIDDDQTILVLLINEYPELFNLMHGDWFDAFKLFK